jgi:hypothetical protein
MDSQSRGLNEKSADGLSRALVLKWHKLTRDFYRIRVTYVTFVKFIYSFSPSLGPHGHRFWPRACFTKIEAPRRSRFWPSARSKERAMLTHSERRATPQSAKRGPPAGLRLRAPRTASPRLSGQPARPALRSLPRGSQTQSRCFNLSETGSKLWQSLLLTGDLHSTVNRVTTTRKSHDSIAYQ